MNRIIDRMVVNSMDQPLMKDEITKVIAKHGNMVKRICFMCLGNKADVDDAFQEVFLKYFLKKELFENEQHEKAWLCRVAFNQCKDFNKTFWRKNMVSLEDLEIPFETPEQNELISAVRQLPMELRRVIYLHYYEGYTVPEIAAICKQNVNTVYTQLRRAKDRLKKKVGELE